MDQVVDTDTAREFMKETLEKVEPEELEKICSEVKAKADWFREKMGPESFGGFSQGDYAEVLKRIFSTRGETRQTLEQAELIEWNNSILEKIQAISNFAMEKSADGSRKERHIFMKNGVEFLWVPHEMFP